MKFLALQTNVRQMQRMFVSEGEEILLSVHHHFFIFLIPMMLKTVVMLLIMGLIGMYLSTSSDLQIIMWGSWVLFLCMWIYAYMFFSSYVDWRYNFLIVTTMKVVIIEQHSVFRHTVLPVHLDKISSINYYLAFYGIGHCGTLNIHLAESLGGTTKNMTLRYMPSPDVITGIVENAGTLLMQKTQDGEKKEDQQQKIENVQQKAEAASGSTES